MESIGELPASALPPGWSGGGAGAGDPEAAQRKAQQVRGGDRKTGIHGCLRAVP